MSEYVSSSPEQEGELYLNLQHKDYLEEAQLNMRPDLVRNDSTLSEVEDLPGLNYSQSESSRVESTRITSSRLLAVQLSSSNSPIASPIRSQQPQKPDTSKQPSDFYFGVCLGEGAYARVVHAKLKKNNKEYAVKIMEKRHIKKENKVKYVMMEKSILSKLNHPFIIRLYYTFQDSGYLYMCMDLAHGGELRSLISSYRQENMKKGIENTAMENLTAQFYLSEIVEALAYLQSQNIIHRDLKPENILITASGHLKITDFGTSSFEDTNDEEMRNSFVGTADYVSPEVLQNENTTRACDVWALGCILFYMLVGRTPFQAASEYLVFQRILQYCDGSEALLYPSSISPAAQSLIHSMLKPIPTERLGGGVVGSGNDMDAVRNHVFFSGVSWSTLLLERPPYIPDPTKFPSTEKMQDGANDDWLFEGEATPILMNQSYGSDSDLGQNGREIHHIVSKEKVDEGQKWKEFLQEGEEHVFTGLIWKRKGLFSRHRLMVLTNKPRLFYVDPATMALKGEIPWDSTHPVKCQAMSEYGFDIHSTLTGRAYHITDSDAGSQMWIDLIHAMVEKQLEDIQKSNRPIESV